MTIRHLPWLDEDRWYVITADRAEEERRAAWMHHGVWLHGPNTMAHAEWNLLGKHGFGVGFEAGRNGSESDIGLSLYAGRLASVWLRFGSPWTKWLRVGRGDMERAKEKDPKGWYNARHTSLMLFPHRGSLFRVEWDNQEHGHGRREFSLTSWKILGRNRSEKIVHGDGSCEIPMPEGVYLATWTDEEHITRYTRWPGTWLDAVRGPRRHRWVNVDIPGCIPVEGKGENSWDCGMDGVCGTSGATLEDAIGNAVRSALRDRKRYGGPHDLPRPMTISEAEAHGMESR